MSELLLDFEREAVCEMVVKVEREEKSKSRHEVKRRRNEKVEREKEYDRLGG